MSGTWKRSTVEPFRHRQPKGPATVILCLQPPRHVSTLLKRRLAEADATPVKPIVERPVPLHGYYFVALRVGSQWGNPFLYRQDTDGTGRKVHNQNSLGFCAYPAVYDGRHRRTFIINEGNVIYSLDNEGKPITIWPSKAELTGKRADRIWIKVDYPPQPPQAGGSHSISSNAQDSHSVCVH